MKIPTICIIGLVFVTSAIQADTIKMGYFEHPPHMMSTADKTPQGATIVYFEKIAKKMGYEVEWLGPFPAGRLMMKIKNGELDGQPHHVDLKMYRHIIDLGNQPYHKAQAIFIVRKENPLNRIASPEDVKGYRIGWIQHVEPSQFVKDNLALFKMDNLASNATMWNRGLKKLLSDRVDALHDLNLFTLPYTAKEMGISDKIKILVLPEPPVPIFVAFSKHSPNSRKLLMKYNQVQSEMKFGDEEYVKLIQKVMDTFVQK